MLQSSNKKGRSVVDLSSLKFGPSLLKWNKGELKTRLERLMCCWLYEKLEDINKNYLIGIQSKVIKQHSKLMYSYSTTFVPVRYESWVPKQKSLLHTNVATAWTPLYGNVNIFLKFRRVPKKSCLLLHLEFYYTIDW